MPDHFHLLMSEPQRGMLSDAIKSLKPGVSRRLIGEAEQYWRHIPTSGDNTARYGAPKHQKLVAGQPARSSGVVTIQDSLSDVANIVR